MRKHTHHWIIAAPDQVPEGQRWLEGHCRTRSCKATRRWPRSQEQDTWRAPNGWHYGHHE